MLKIDLPLELYRVDGPSMLPTYSPGDLLLGWRWFRPKVGQVVVAKTPERQIIKRIKRIEKSNYWIEGDNQSQSTDSRHFGALERRQLSALIIGKIA